MINVGIALRYSTLMEVFVVLGSDFEENSEEKDK